MKKSDTVTSDSALLLQKAEAILKNNLAEAFSALSESEAINLNQDSCVCKVKMELSHNIHRSEFVRNRINLM